MCFVCVHACMQPRARARNCICNHNVTAKRILLAARLNTTNRLGSSAVFCPDPAFGRWGGPTAKFVCPLCNYPMGKEGVGTRLQGCRVFSSVEKALERWSHREVLFMETQRFGLFPGGKRKEGFPLAARQCHEDTRLAVPPGLALPPALWVRSAITGEA